MLQRTFWRMPAVAVVMLLTLANCRKDKAPPPADDQVTSLLFGATSPEAREALATPVDLRLNESNFAQWERAQRFLEAVPRSDFAGASGTGGNAIDRAVATLEASPRARTAIERTGLSVRDFVLLTIALAQAAEARAGKPPSGVNVPAENVQFVERYQSRILQARTESRAMRARVDTYNADTAGLGAQSINVTPEVRQGADVLTTDSAAVGERGQHADSARREGQAPERPKPPSDTVRDTIPR